MIEFARKGMPPESRSHTKLNELGLEGQLRHWYLLPMMGYEGHVSSEVVARGKMQDMNQGTRIADFWMAILSPYLRAAFIGIRNCAGGNGARTWAHQGEKATRVRAIEAMTVAVSTPEKLLHLLHAQRRWNLKTSTVSACETETRRDKVAKMEIIVSVTFNIMWDELCPPSDASRLPGKPAVSQFEQMSISTVKQLTQWKRAPTMSCWQLHPH